ncbi:MAG: hypothetical protein ACLUU0_11070 [Anaerostipes hadrus]
MKKLKLVSFVIFCISLAASLIFWFTQVRKGDRIGPVITMNQQELTVGLNATDEDFLQGVKAVDENDGDVTDSLVVESVSNFLGGGRRLVVYAKWTDIITSAVQTVLYSIRVIHHQSFI